jgi:hypothetical protein
MSAMRPPPPSLPHRLLAVALSLGAFACGAVPDDPGARIFAVRGAIRGTIVYRGERPCSRGGHIVGSAVLLLFDVRNPPPPDGLATTAPNFVAVTGDVLFGGEPRYAGPDVYCPAQAGFTETITASAPFELAPIDAAGAYEIRALYDTDGDFLPEFSIRNLPDQGDVVGGDVDTGDALLPANAGNPDYRPRFVPIVVGVATGDASASGPSYVFPDSGFVADNVTVTLGAPVESPRPYFYAQGAAVSFDATAGGVTVKVAQSSDQPPTADRSAIAGTTATDPDATPVLTIPQDISVFAPPSLLSAAAVDHYESALPHLVLPWGLPVAELARAGASPFDLPVSAFGDGPSGAGFLVWQDATVDPMTGAYVPRLIPEGTEPSLWPVVTLTRIAEPGDGPNAPLVLLQGITLLGGRGGDTLFGTALASFGNTYFTSGTAAGAAGPRPVVFAQDHLAVVLRPSVLCIPTSPTTGQAVPPGKLVTPRLQGTTADVDCSSGTCVGAGTPNQPLAPATLLQDPALAALVTGDIEPGCLPTGRFAIHVLYPNGQAWTVPNEAGVCAASEGPTDYAARTCVTEPRPVLYSQGTRAVVEIVPAQDPAFCAAFPVPADCLPSR